MPEDTTPDQPAISVQTALTNAGWRFPAQQTTYPEVFIIESLRSDDELRGDFEGLRIAKTLRNSGKIPKYFYIHDDKELELLVPVFRQSGSTATFIFHAMGKRMALNYKEDS